MSIFDSIFGDTQKTAQKQQSSQQGTGFSQSNLWPQISPYFSQYANTAFNPAPFNQYQTGAADAQTGVISNLMPAYNAAWNIAGSGIDPNRIAAFQSPYQSQVINAYKGYQDDIDAEARGQLTSQFARTPGALTGSSYRGEMRGLRGDQADAQGRNIANLLNTGFGQASNLAAQDAALRLQGAGTVAGVTNAATGATTAGFNQGQQLWQNPLSWMTQGAAGMAPFLQGAGQNTNFTGQSQGTGSNTSTASPSPFSVGSNLLGLGMSLFSDERLKDNIKQVGETFDGLPIYKFNFPDGPTQIGLMAQDVEQRRPDAVGSLGGAKTVNYDTATEGAERGGFRGGGAVGGGHGGDDDFADKVYRAFKTFHKIRREMGGRVTDMEPDKDGTYMPRRDMGGGIPVYSANEATPGDYAWFRDGYRDPLASAPSVASDPTWGTLIERAPEGPNMWTKAGQGLRDLGQNVRQGRPQQGSSVDLLGGAQQGLGTALSGMMSTHRGYAEGGDVEPLAAHTDSYYEPATNWDDQTGLPQFSGNSMEAPPLSFAGAPPAPAVASGPTADVAPVTPEAKPSVGFNWLDFLPKPDFGGMWAGEKPTPMQNMGTALMSVAGPRFAGPTNAMAERISKMQQQRFHEMEAERAAAALMGKFNGQETLAARQLAAEQAARAATQKYQADLLAETARHNKAIEAPDAVRIATAMGYKEGTPEFQEAIKQILLKGKMTLTPGQEAIDKKFADDYVQWKTGGAADAIKNLSQIEGVAKDLATKPNLTGPVVGLIPDVGLAFVNPAAIDTRERVYEVAQRNLRQILGAQFTEKEGQQLIRRTYNESLKPEVNALRVMRLFKQMDLAAKAKQEAVNYFDQHGTLTGWKGQLPSLADFNPDKPFTNDEVQALTGKAAAEVAPTAVPATPESARERLKSLPDGVHSTGIGPIIKRGDTIMRPSGEPGSVTNPFPNLWDIKRPGQYAFDEKGQLVRRTSNMFSDLYEVVPDASVAQPGSYTPTP